MKWIKLVKQHQTVWCVARMIMLPSNLYKSHIVSRQYLTRWFVL
jgi:hypothetical protein